MKAAATSRVIGAKAERWEHMRLVMTNTAERDLATINALGGEGWQLVQITIQAYWLKRRIA